MLKMKMQMKIEMKMKVKTMLKMKMKMKMQMKMRIVLKMKKRCKCHNDYTTCCYYTTYTLSTCERKPAKENLRKKQTCAKKTCEMTSKQSFPRDLPSASWVESIKAPVREIVWELIRLPWGTIPP